MGQARNLGIELEARLALCLRELQLSLLELADIRDTDRAAERPEDPVFSRVNDRPQRIRPTLDVIMRGLCLCGG